MHARRTDCVALLGFDFWDIEVAPTENMGT